MITIIVSGTVPVERARLAGKVLELVQTMGLTALRYPRIDVRPTQTPEGLQVAVVEATPERPCQVCADRAAAVQESEHTGVPGA